MGLYPDLLPGYVPVCADTPFQQEWPAMAPVTPG